MIWRRLRLEVRGTCFGLLGMLRVNHTNLCANTKFLVLGVIAWYSCLVLALGKGSEDRKTADLSLLLLFDNGYC